MTLFPKWYEEDDFLTPSIEVKHANYTSDPEIIHQRIQREIDNSCAEKVPYHFDITKHFYTFIKEYL